jgi:hypothetical protein
MRTSTSDVLQRFLEHLPLATTDRVLVVLKGHLLVEELLRQFINVHMPSPQRLVDARLTFHQCLCMARAFSKDNMHEKLWDATEKLNGLRNKLAHALEPKEVDVKLREFVELLSDFHGTSEFADSEKKFGVLTSCVLAICLALSEAVQRVNFTVVSDSTKTEKSNIAP